MPFIITNIIGIFQQMLKFPFKLVEESCESQVSPVLLVPPFLQAPLNPEIPDPGNQQVRDNYDIWSQ